MTPTPKDAKVSHHTRPARAERLRATVEAPTEFELRERCPECGSKTRHIEPPEPADPECGIHERGALTLCSDCGHEFEEGPRKAEREDERREMELEHKRNN